MHGCDAITHKYDFLLHTILLYRLIQYWGCTVYCFTSCCSLNVEERCVWLSISEKELATRAKSRWRRLFIQNSASHSGHQSLPEGHQINSRGRRMVNEAEKEKKNQEKNSFSATYTAYFRTAGLCRWISCIFFFPGQFKGSMVRNWM